MIPKKSSALAPFLIGVLFSMFMSVGIVLNSIVNITPIKAIMDLFFSSIIIAMVSKIVNGHPIAAINGKSNTNHITMKKVINVQNPKHLRQHQGLYSRKLGYCF